VKNTAADAKASPWLKGPARAEARMIACCETMRLTARLTGVMAWLMVQRAVEAGEINRSETVKKHYRLTGQEVCAASHPEAGKVLPPRFNSLLEQSGALYGRIARLDSMLG
jgi:regulator of CtrA degradation